MKKQALDCETVGKENVCSLKVNNRNKALEVAQQIVNILETTDVAEWHKAWDWSKGGSFKNAKTGIRYRGLNLMRLYAAKVVNHYKDNRWLTFKQVKQLGGNVKSGEKSVELIFYTQWDKKEKEYFDLQKLVDKKLSDDEIHQYIRENVYLCTKSFNVFNVGQCEGLKLTSEPLPTKEEIEVRTSKIADEIIANSLARVYFDGLDRAFYSPFTDTVHVPEIKCFDTKEDYYATVLHEIGHSTGHPSRLNRDFSGSFGSASYAREELVAEFAAAMLQNEADIILTGKHLENHASYIKSWLDHTKTNDRAYELQKAISDAQKASNYVCKNYINSINN